jgi:radical SAM superfamily enzyme YgiQ (UPF0313 family)
MSNQFTPIPQALSQAEILLINPDFAKTELGLTAPHENHLGLNRLASFLDQKGISVQILNTTGLAVSQDEPEQLGQWLNKNQFKYDIFGFYTTSWNIAHIARLIKEFNSSLLDKPIFLGGPLASAAPAPLIAYLRQCGLKNIGLVQGFGEFLLEKMIRHKNNLAAVSGAWSYQNGQLTAGALQTFTPEDLASLPLLNHQYNTFFKLYYEPWLDKLELGTQTLDIIFGSMGLDTNLGCPFNCTYCSIPFLSRNVVTRTPRRVVDELQFTAEKTGIFRYTFTYSNNMFYTREWLQEFCQEIITRKMDHYLRWNGYHHLNILNNLPGEDFCLMKDAGAAEVVIGVQSIEQSICQLFKRPPDTFAKVKKLVSKLAQAGLQLVVDYITSVPGEKTEKIAEFYQFCLKHNIECRNYDLKLYPGTELATQGLDLTNHDLVPITGEVPPELGAYLLVPKTIDHQLTRLQLLINNNNQKINQSRLISLGKQKITSQRIAKELLEEEIPLNPYIPPRVKQAMCLLLQELINPKAKTASTPPFTMEMMFNQMAKINEKSPPILHKLKEQMVKKMGESRFQELLNRYRQ